MTCVAGGLQQHPSAEPCSYEPQISGASMADDGQLGMLNGSLDVQVPAKENLAAARQALRNNSHATVTELTGMNHLLQIAKTGAPSE